MTILQPIDSKGYVFRCSREARLGTWSLEKEKRDKNSCTPTLVIYSINYSRDYRRVKKNFTGWRIRANNCKRSAFNGTVQIRGEREKRWN